MENEVKNTTETTEGTSEATETKAEKTYTQAEVESMIDSRISKAYEKWNKKQAEAVAEAQKLAQMNAEERTQYEFEQRVKEFERKEAEFNKMQFKLQAVQVMSERGLPTTFAEMLVGEDAETTLDNIKKFEVDYKSAINDAVKLKLASPVPKASTATQGGITKESFAKMTLAQQAEIAQTNPTLYKQLTQR